jgi:hypothetical protein
MTRIQADMLRKANARSLPGDGLLIKGAGPHRAARALEAMGYVRVARPHPGLKARVHITPAGRARLDILPELL